MWQEAAALRDFNPTFVRFGSKADITVHRCHVRFTRESGHWSHSAAASRPQLRLPSRFETRQLRSLATI
jgi:hypothetical protein